MLSVVIPVLNEEHVIETNTRKLSKFLGGLNVNYEIIICDNGSIDSTKELAERLSQEAENIKIISVPQKGAVGKAFSECVKTASYDNIISLDMDLSSDLDFIPRALKLLESESMVIGSKKERQRRPLHRIAISSAYIALVRILLGLDFSDYSMSSKAYRKSDIAPYLENLGNGSSYVIRLANSLRENGNRVKEIPVACDDRRKSRFSLKNEIYHRFVDLIRLRIST